MNVSLRYLIVCLALVLITVLLGSPADGYAQSAPVDSFVHNGFIRVIDGDTVEIWHNNSRLGIGYVGIDAPEGNTACGQAATARQWELLGGGAQFTSPAGLAQDTKGRRMYAVSTLGGQSIEEILVSEGFATVTTPPSRVASKLRLLEAKARSEGRGCVWGSKNGPTPTPRQFPARKTPSFVVSPLIPQPDGLLPQDVSVPGFEDRLVSGGFAEPTTFDFAPDGRIFVAEKTGKIKVIKNGQLLANPLLDITSRVNDYWDHGLIGLAVDPGFATNGYIYVLYTYENNSADYSGTKTGRLSRFTVIGDVASPASEVVLMGTLNGSTCDAYPVGSDCIPADGPSHSVGAVRFGIDGKIYATFGDASSFNFVDDNALRTQDVNRLNGKVVRINTDGTGVADNPFWDGNANHSRSKVWAYGVRNAFRFNFRPGSGSLYLGDVGWNEREEIDVVTRGSNLGWPCYEGSVRQSGYQSRATCQTLYAAGTAAVKMPLVDWTHAEGGCCGAAAVGGAFATNYSPPFDDAYFYADYSQEWIRYLKTDSSDQITVTPQPFMTNTNAPVSIQRGLNGEIYYLAINTGEIRHIRQTGGNREPAAVISATPSDGLAPLAVSFSAAGSTDPDNDALTFIWNFGDGATATGASASHTYASNGSFVATLTASDGAGGTDTVSQTITVGNRRPLVTIASPANSSTYAVGQHLSLTGSAIDPDDGPVQASALTWTVTLHHNGHIHPFLTAIGASAAFDVPDHGDNTYITIQLDAVDGGGLHGQTAITLLPQNILLTLDSSPSGLTLSYDGVTVVTPFVATTVVNSSHTIGAPSPQGTAVFRSWSDSGAGFHNITLGATNTSRLATFDAAQAITFDDIGAVNRPFSGQYPAGVASWPAGSWFLSGPWGEFGTNSVSFTTSQQKSGSFTFLSPRVLLSFQAYNGGATSSTITASCGTNPVVSQVLASGEMQTVSTNWTAPCTTVAWTSSNGWDTNFDTFIHDSVAAGDITPPVVTGVQSTLVTSSSATITWNSDEPATSQVEYGTSTGYGTLAPLTPDLTLVTAHSQPLSGLAGNTTYHYRVLSKDAAGNSTASPDSSFVTPPADATPPIISAVQATAVTSTSATVTWTTNESSTTQVEYGPTAAYGSLAPSQPNPALVTAHSQALSGLAIGTQYHFRVLSRDAAGNLATSPDATFTTTVPDTTPPVITGQQDSVRTQTGATIVWLTNEASTTQVAYGTTPALGSLAPASANPALVTTHSQALTGLTSGTVYFYCVISTDAAGNTATSPTLTFTTLADTSAPAISAVQASAITQTGATITWTTNEGSTTQVEYGPATSYGSFAPGVPNPAIVTSHSQSLTGLAAATTYNYRVLSRDPAGNLATSANFTFTTASAGASLQFDGSNDRATANDSNSLDLVGPLTLEAWVKFDSLPAGKWQTLIFKGATSTSLAYALYYHDGLWLEIKSGSSSVILQDNRPLQTGV
ncbi:hypothetical protein AYO38_10375, partial [bacterium SCGC AG-212-C10]